MRTRHERLYHLALASDWETARAGDTGYRTSTLGQDLADVGFIHCSYADQVKRIADLVYRDRDDVLLLTIDPDLLVSRVVEEAARANGPAEDVVDAEEVPEEDLFPHVYGPIDLEAVIDVTPLALHQDGTLDIPIVPSN